MVFFSGHTDQLFHPQGWDFHLKTVVAFGTAVRLQGFLGVRQSSIRSKPSEVSLTKEPGRRLVYD